MNSSDFIKQYNAAITNKSTNNEIDDFSFMDVFGDSTFEPKDNKKTEEDDFSFFDLDDISDVDAAHTVEEIDFTSSKKEVSSSKIAGNGLMQTYIKSVSVEPHKGTFSTTETLRDSFFLDLYEDDYSIDVDNLVSTFNKAFNENYNDEYLVLAKYIHIYYGIQLPVDSIKELVLIVK